MMERIGMRCVGEICSRGNVERVKIKLESVGPATHGL
jgi:hypothetical protein